MQGCSLDRGPRNSQSRGLVDFEEIALVNFVTRSIGLIITATLFASGVAAQDFSLPDPDGLELPNESILGPGFDSGPMDRIDSLPIPDARPMPAPGTDSTHYSDEMAPSRLVGPPQVMSGPYEPYEDDSSNTGFQPDGNPWQHWGPDDQPYLGWDGKPAVPESSGTWLDRGVWFGEVDAVVLTRVWKKSDVLYAAQDPNVTSPIFNPSLLQTNRVMWLKNSHPGKDVAVRATLGRFLMRDDHNRDHVIEFTAFGGGDWIQDISISATDGQFLFTPFDVAGSQNRDFSGSNFQRMIYTSRFNSFEANYHVKRRLGRDQMIMDPNGCWRRVANNGWKRDYLAGLRFFELIEHIDWTAENIIDTGTDGRYIVNTRNSLFGTQVGGGIGYETGRWNLGIHTKLGLYINDADARSQLYFSDDEENFDRFTTEDELSFLTEVNVRGRWYATPNTAIRASLDLLYLESVALAPDQINFLPVYSQITSTGDPVYLGGSLGFECYW